MELDRFIAALLRRWYVVVLCVAVGVACTYGYFQWFATSQAEATVAVLEPAVVKATNNGQQAQISFASVAESYVVAERVVTKRALNIPPRSLQKAVTVKLSRSLIANIASPLYIVSVSDPDPDRAIMLADAVVDESILVFNELNQLTPEQVTAAFAPEEQRLRQELDQARRELAAYEKQNQAQQLPDKIAAQRGLVSSLQQTVVFSGAQGTVAAASSEALLKNYREAVVELERLRALLPEYQRLSFDVTLQAGLYQGLAGRSIDPALTTPASALTNQAKKLDDARKALNAFEVENSARDLPSQVAAQLALANELRLQYLTSYVSAETLANARATESAELERLVALLPRYQELSQRVLTTSARIEQLEQRKLDTVINSSVTTSAQIKVLDRAMIGTNTLWTIVLYVLGIALGAFVGVVAVYLWGYYDRTPRAEDEVEALVGFPVLARVPRA